MSSPHLVIDETFFKQLWPLILEENICDTRSKNTSPYFVPKKKFDALWAHGFLASKNYGEYEPPICFHCSPCAEQEPSFDESLHERISIHIDDEGERVCEFSERNRIPTLDEQFARLEKKREFRQKLADNFKNRKIPWYIPCCRLKSDIINDIQYVFTKPFERQLFRAIHLFECKFMIINLGTNICLSQIENWLKFCKYIKIILIVRKQELAENLSLLNPALYPMVFQDVCENTWQQELTRALNAGVSHAENVKIMTHCAVAFVYVFSSMADLDCLNKFRVLRKT